DGEEGFSLQLAAHLRAHRLALRDLVLPLPDALVERAGDGIGDRLCARVAFGRIRAEPCAHLVRGVGAEVVDVGAPEAHLVKGRPDLPRLDPVRDFKLHRRSAGELDAVIEAARGEEDRADQHDPAREGKRHTAPFDEVIVCVREESDHQILRVTMSGRRFSHMRNSVFTTKIAEIIEATIPMIREMAKPWTGPVPTAWRMSAVRMVLTFESTMAFMEC